MAWWIWAVAGLVLLIGEMLTPGGVLVIFFAAGAFLVGLLELMGLDMALWVELLLFTAVSVISLMIFRKPILRRIEKQNPKEDVDSMVGEEVVAGSAFGFGEMGTVELRGSPWQARNTGDVAIAVGDICQVHAVHGVRLDVRSKQASK